VAGEWAEIPGFSGLRLRRLRMKPATLDLKAGIQTS